MTTPAAPLFELLGSTSSASGLDVALTSLSLPPSSALERKDLGPVSYLNALQHGVSLQFEQSNKEAADDGTWTCQAVDVYNEGYDRRWKVFAGLPLLLSWRRESKEMTLTLASETTGADLVSVLGEPTRKGGGEALKGGGASGLGPGAWMEWTATMHDRRFNLMVELMGTDVRGAGRWEKDKGGAAVWGVCTLSLASSQ